MPDLIRHPEKPASLIHLDNAETLHFVPGLRPLVSQAQGRFFPDIRDRKHPLACHSEGATRTKAKALKKMPDPRTSGKETGEAYAAIPLRVDRIPREDYFYIEWHG